MARAHGGKAAASLSMGVVSRFEVILGRLRTAAGLCATPSSRKCHDYAVCSSLDFFSLKHIVPAALKAAGGFAAADTRALEQGLVCKEQEKEKTSRERENEQRKSRGRVGSRGTR